MVDSKTQIFITCSQVAMAAFTQKDQICKCEIRYKNGKVTQETLNEEQTTHIIAQLRAESAGQPGFIEIPGESLDNEETTQFINKNAVHEWRKTTNDLKITFTIHLNSSTAVLTTSDTERANEMEASLSVIR